MAKREVWLSLNDVEVAALLHKVEEDIEEYEQENYDRYPVQVLHDKLNTALSKFNQPEIEAPLFVNWWQAKDLANAFEMLADEYEWWELEHQEKEDVQNFMEHLQEIAKRLEPKSEDDETPF